MGRQNKKEAIAALHRESILNAAEKLFIEKGVGATTIADISKASEYSRRTIYAYFESKEEILYHIILKGLISLKNHILQAIAEQQSFLEQYYAICHAMKEYFLNSPQSFQSVNQANTKEMDFSTIPPVVKQIFTEGTEINNTLASFIETGKKCGMVMEDINTMKTVYIMWSSISSLFMLMQSKGAFLEVEFGSTQDEFLTYGFNQIINGILKERII